MSGLIHDWGCFVISSIHNINHMIKIILNHFGVIDPLPRKKLTYINLLNTVFGVSGPPTFICGHIDPRLRTCDNHFPPPLFVIKV